MPTIADAQNHAARFIRDRLAAAMPRQPRNAARSLYPEYVEECALGDTYRRPLTEPQFVAIALTITDALAIRARRHAA